MPEASDIKKYF